MVEILRKGGYGSCSENNVPRVVKHFNLSHWKTFFIYTIVSIKHSTFFFWHNGPGQGTFGTEPLPGDSQPTNKTLGLVQYLFGTLRTFSGPSKSFSNVRDLQNLLGTFTAFRDIQDLFGTFKDLLATLGTVQTFWALFWTFRTFLGPAKAF